MPLSSLFGPDALEVRLRDSGARIAVVDTRALGKIEECRAELPALERVLITDAAPSSLPCRTLDDAVAQASPDIPPTALKMMRRGDVRAGPEVMVRTIMGGGESLGEETLHWVRDRFGTTVNEIFGQTECNYVLGNSSALFPVVPGSTGKPYPGHDVAVVDDQGQTQPAGVPGEIAVRMPDPVAFLGYWEKPDATVAKYRGDWLLTGDFAEVDEHGYFRYVGRRDDLINSSGYRIGPTEIESCLMRHPAVGLAAIIGVPDPIRGEVVKACVLPRDGVTPDEALARDIQGFVKA